MKIKFSFIFFFFAIISCAFCAPTESEPKKRKPKGPVDIIWQPIMHFAKGSYKLMHTLGIQPFTSLFGLIFGGLTGSTEKENNAQLFYKSNPDDVTFQPACSVDLLKVANKDSSDIILAPASCIRERDRQHSDLLKFRAEVDGKSYKIIDTSEYDGDESEASEIKKEYKLLKLEAPAPFTGTCRPARISDGRIKRWANRFEHKPLPHDYYK